MNGFEADYEGIGEMLRGEIGLAAVLPKAQSVKQAAEAIAPVRTGDYKSKFDIETSEGDDRVEAWVINTSGHAYEVEFGGGNTPRHRTLGRALGVAK